MPELLNVLTGGDAYKQSMLDFQRNAKFYPQPYKAVMRYLFQHTGQVIKSKELARMFFPGRKPEDAGVYIREIIRHARRCGHPVCSSTNGYFIETDYEKMVDNLRNLESRALDLLYTVGKMKKLCRNRKQLKMRLVA